MVWQLGRDPMEFVFISCGTFRYVNALVVASHLVMSIIRTIRGSGRGIGDCSSTRTIWKHSVGNITVKRP